MPELKTLDKVRIDKWLWAVRICKTRSTAMDLCKRGKVTLDGILIKPSREIKPEQTVQVKLDGIMRVFQVVQCIDKRVGAKIADTCKKDLTPESEFIRLIQTKKGRMPQREQGSGRPTKKERRSLEKFRDV